MEEIFTALMSSLKTENLLVTLPMEVNTVSNKTVSCENLSFAEGSNVTFCSIGSQEIRRVPVKNVAIKIRKKYRLKVELVDVAFELTL